MNDRSQDIAATAPHEQDWVAVEASLNANGNALLPGLLTPDCCSELIAMYSEEKRYRSRIVMARHGFGAGEYKYFSYPLPEIISQLRAALYLQLAPVGNRWNQLMGIDIRYPAQLNEFLERCHAAGQVRPTPLILEYADGGYNRLHQDLYGEHIFPLQAAILLSKPGEDFTGGEFVMTEKSNSAQRANVVPLRQGDGVVFAVSQRPEQNKRAIRRVATRHGVSRIRSGIRHTIGLIFHDSK